MGQLSQDREPGNGNDDRKGGTPSASHTGDDCHKRSDHGDTGLSGIRKVNKEAVDATRGNYLHSFPEILDFSDSEVGGIEQACFETVR
jgi:hypothetical protein